MPSSLALLTEEARSCVRCKLSEQGRTQVVVGMGDPSADLMFVGEGPGAEEDRQGLPFVGRSGKLLDQLIFEELGVTRDRVYITNVVKCRPPNNRDPQADEIDACNPWLDQQLELVDPKVIVTLGKFASQLLLDTKQGITKLRGKTYPFGDRALVPTVHPAYVLRGGGEPMAQMRADLVRAKQVLAERGAALT